MPRFCNFRPDGDSLLVELSRGLEARVDNDTPTIVLLSLYAWHASPNKMGDYYAMSIDGDGRTVYMHRLIMAAPKGKIVAHRNSDTLDNRRENLRVGGDQAIHVSGDIAEIELSKGLFALVDPVDIPLVAQYQWYAFPNRMGGYYAALRTKESGTLYMHRLIMDAPKGKVVDHLNHDTLDNRRVNLRVGGQRENLQNRQRANSNSSTGVRGVYQHHVYNKKLDWHGIYWNVRVMVDGKSKTKNFPHTTEGFAAACTYVEELRDLLTSLPSS